MRYRCALLELILPVGRPAAGIAAPANGHLRYAAVRINTARRNPSSWAAGDRDYGVARAADHGRATAPAPDGAACGMKHRHPVMRDR